MNPLRSTCCPHCGETGIRPIAKRWSSRELPARCTHCGGLSHVIASTSSGIPVFTFLVMTCSVVAGAAWDEPWWGAACGAPIAMAYNVWAWRRAPMFPISALSAGRSGKAAWLVAILSLLGLLAQ